jgi:hypothetical protein
MPKRMRVVTAGSEGTQRVAVRRRIVTSDNNPPVSNRLTENEKVLRKKYSTSTTFGKNSNDRITVGSVLATNDQLGGMRIASDVIDSGTAQFYSPQLSTDFLEKPQNLRERRAFYRFFYNTNEIVGQAIDVHSTLPLSKLRLVAPKGKNPHQNQYVMKFFEDMCDGMKLFRTLLEVTHEYNLFGNCFIFAEESDSYEDMTPEESAKKKEEARQRSEFLKQKYKIEDKDPLYKGWKKLIILPPDQVRVRKLPLTDEVAIEYVPDPQTKEFIVQGGYYAQTAQGDQKKYSMPAELQDKVKQSGVIPLDTDPSSGSHVYHLARRKSQYEPLGVSMIERCINTLVLLDKLRQAQTSIASRHMTPMRIVWAEDLSVDDVDNLREQVDMALVDPDYSIITNYEVHWEEMGSQGRLLDIEAENEAGLNRLLAGLGMTREILTGEGSYSGSKISLEIMNTQYLLFREIIQDYVENYLFKPVARKKGFIEYDDYGNEVILYPKLSFTRLAIRDNEQFFDSAFQLYQKGSISIDLILDILNIDPISTKHKIEQDLFTVNDSIFNELMRNIYTNLSAPLVEQTDMVDKVAKYLNLNKIEQTEAPPGAKRFSSNNQLMSEDKIKLAKVMKFFKDNPEMLNKIFDKVEKDAE